MMSKITLDNHELPVPESERFIKRHGVWMFSYGEVFELNDEPDGGTYRGVIISFAGKLSDAAVEIISATAIQHFREKDNQAVLDALKEDRVVDDKLFDAKRSWEAWRKERMRK